MAQSKLPAMQWYPGDWRKDPGIQALDYYDRGVWRELLDVMHESAERGRLVFPTGQPMPDAAIARLLGIEEAKWKQIRSRLMSYGVASEDEDGVLYNRRMVRDEEIRQARAEAGRKGGKKSRPSKGQSKREAKQEAKRGSSSSSSASASTKGTTTGDESPEAGASPNKPDLGSLDIADDTDWATLRSTLFEPLREHIWQGKKPPARVPKKGRKWGEGRELSYIRQWIRADFFEPDEAEDFLRLAPAVMGWRDPASLSWLAADEHIPRIREIVGRVRKDRMRKVSEVFRG